MILLNLVGSVPTCEVAASLFKDYEKNVMTGINPAIPLGGIILQAAIYTGTFINDMIISIGRSILPAGCLIQNRDPSQEEKEEDRLEKTEMSVTGHYRFTFSNDLKRLIEKIS